MAISTYAQIYVLAWNAYNVCFFNFLNFWLEYIYLNLV